MTRFISMIVVSLSLVGCGQFGPTVEEDTGDVNVDTDVIDTQDETDVEDEETDTQVEPQCPNSDVDFLANGDPMCDFSWMDRVVLRVNATNPNIRLAKDITPSQYTDQNFLVPVGDVWSAEIPLWDSADSSGYNDATAWGLIGTRAVTIGHPNGTVVQFANLSGLLGIDPAVMANPFPTSGVPDVFLCIQRPGGVGEVYVGDYSECLRQIVAANAAALDDGGDGEVDVWFRDYDGDGEGDAGTTLESATQPTGYVSNDWDCYDTKADVNTRATEIDNDLDDDCDGLTDEGFTSTATDWYADADADGYGNPYSKTSAVTKPSGYVADKTDCDDARNSVHPGATETASDGIDQNCDGSDLASSRSAQTVVIQPDAAVCARAWTVMSMNVSAGGSWTSPVSVAAGTCSVSISVTFAIGDHVVYNGAYVGSDGVTTYWLGDSRVSGYESLTAITGPGGANTIAAERNDANGVGYDHDGTGYDAGVLSMK